jgi:hypothetical protein
VAEYGGVAGRETNPLKVEVTDLDEFRNAVAELKKESEVIQGPLIVKLDAAIEVAGKHLRPLRAQVLATGAFDAAFAAACKDLIEAHGEIAPGDRAARVDKVEAILAEKRAKTFATKGFDRKPLLSWTEPSKQQHETLARYLTERGKIDEEARRLTNLFRQALALPAVANASDSINCPLCGGHESLTPERIAFIRARVADTEVFKVAEKAGRETLSQMVSSLTALANGVSAALPAFITNSSKFRRSGNFCVGKIRELLGGEHKAAIDAWLVALRRLMRRCAALRVSENKLAALIGPSCANPEALTDAEAISQALQMRSLRSIRLRLR